MIDVQHLLGDDHLANEFTVLIPPFPGAVDTSGFTLRIKEFNLPEFSIGTYELNYKSIKITKPLARRTAENSFTFSFRMDKYFRQYQQIRTWMESILKTYGAEKTVNEADLNLGQAVLNALGLSSLSQITTGGIENLRRDIFVIPTFQLGAGFENPIISQPFIPLTGAGGWQFYSCWPSSLGQIAYSQDNGEAVYCEVTMQYAYQTFIGGVESII